MMFELKEFGRSAHVSEVILGTMRLPPNATVLELSELLIKCHEGGITTHHSSPEYDSYPRYLEALHHAQTTGRSFRHVVKLAEPSWDSARFDPTRFRLHVDRLRNEHRSDSLDVVQWMSRTKDPTNDLVRLPALHRDWELASNEFARVKDCGQAKAVACFGYTDAFLTEVVSGGLVDGAVGYYNPLEPNNTMLDLGVPTIGIRPFAGGELFEQGWSASELIEFALRPAHVAATILSVSSASHLDQLTVGFMP